MDDSLVSHPRVLYTRANKAICPGVKYKYSPLSVQSFLPLVIRAFYLGTYFQQQETVQLTLVNYQSRRENVAGMVPISNGQEGGGQGPSSHISVEFLSIIF